MGPFTSRLSNSLMPALACVEPEMSTYYVLGYAPPRPGDHRFRAIRARVPSLTARTKKVCLAGRSR